MERNNIDGFLGCGVKVRVAEGIYEGIISKIDRDLKRITLKNVELTENDKSPIQILGLLHFFGHEIEEIKFVDEEFVRRRVDNMYTLMKPFRKPSHLIGQEIPKDSEIIKMGRGEETRFMVPEIDTSDWPKQTFIAEIDSFFAAAVEQLKQASIISIAPIGVNLSRFGTLCCLAIMPSSSYQVYIFDICSLGAAAFENGLKEILESSQIVKILHDCRFISDLLQYQYGVNLQHVFDTQVGHVIVFKQTHGGDLPKYVTSLPKCLQDVLNFDANKFPMVWYRSYAMEKDQSIWKKRPLPSYLRNHLVASVMHLPKLRLVLIEKMSTEFLIGVEINLQVAKEQTDANLHRMMKNTDLLSGSFLRLNEKAAERRFEVDKTSHIDPLTGMRDSVGRLNYSALRFSRDAWHGQLLHKDSFDNETNEKIVPLEDLDQ